MIITTKTPRHKVKTKDIKDKIFFCVFVVKKECQRRLAAFAIFACSAPPDRSRGHALREE